MNKIIQSEELEKKLKMFLSSELRAIISDRAPREEKWKKWRRQRAAQLDDKNKTSMYPDVPKIATPLALISTNTLFSQIKATFMKSPFFIVDPQDKTSEKDRAIADAMGTGLSILSNSPYHLNLPAVSNTILYENTSIGTQIMYVPWFIDTYEFTRNITGTEERVRVPKHIGPAVIPIRPEQFYIREYNTNLQTADMFAIENWLTEYELRKREADGIYDNIDRVLGYKQTTPPGYVTENIKSTNGQSQAYAMYRIFEIYVFAQTTDGSKQLQDIRVWYHLETDTILREEYNNLGLRPIVAANHMKTPYSIWGTGVGAVAEGLQDSYDMLFHNSLISTMFSSLQMAAADRNAVDAGLQMEMGKVLMLDKPPNEAIQVFEFPNTTPSNMMMMQMMQMLLQQGAGSTDALSGFPDSVAKSGATASGTQFQAAQGMRILQSVTIEGIEQAFGEVGMFVIFQMILHKDEMGDILALFPPGVRQIFETEILTIKPEDLMFKFKFKVSTSQPDQTDEARKQKYLSLTQLYSMYGQQLIGMLQNMLSVDVQVQQTGQQNSPVYQLLKESVYRLFANANKIMEKVLDEFGMPGNNMTAEYRDIDMLTSVMENMRMVKTQMMLGGGGFGGAANGMASVAGPAPAPGTSGGGGSYSPPSGSVEVAGGQGSETGAV